MAREAYDTGVSICRPLYYDFPEVDEAYNYEGEYMFGNDILVAPITESASDGISTKEIWFPEGNWWSVSTNELIEGPCVKKINFRMDQIPYFFRQGSMIPNYPVSVKSVTEHPEEMIINVVSGGLGEGGIYEDSGDNADYANNYSMTRLLCKSYDNVEELVVRPRDLKGDVTGLAESRSYTFKIYNCGKPEKVTLQNKIMNRDNYSYDSDTRILTVRIPVTKCNSEINLCIVQSKD